MPSIQLVTHIKAPIERCFDLSRSIDLHKISTSHTEEEAIDGITSGLIGAGEFVTWKARHFGISQRLTTRITEYKKPIFFVDEMQSGAFKSFRHEHHFEFIKGQTEMKDVFDFESPLGVLGRLANSLFLKTYMTNLLYRRNLTIKEFAESEKWKEVLTPTS